MVKHACLKFSGLLLAIGRAVSLFHPFQQDDDIDGRIQTITAPEPDDGDSAAIEAAVVARPTADIRPQGMPPPADVPHVFWENDTVDDTFYARQEGDRQRRNVAAMLYRSTNHA